MISELKSPLTRRRWFENVYTAMAGLGLLNLLGEANAETTAWQAGRGMAHHPPKAKRVLQIFCPGAASHIDLWEHKPSLEKYHGKPLPGEENFVSFQGKNGNLMKSPWPMPPAGETGKRISSMLPEMARHVDDIAFIHSMTSKTNTHGPGCIFMNTGHAQEGFPSAGAWLSYALGSENENLPTYVAIPDIRGEPPNGKANWSNGFLPARHQAIMMNAQHPIRNLARPESISAKEEQATRELLQFLNERDAQAHPGQSELEARIKAYTLAARMQLSAPRFWTFAPNRHPRIGFMGPGIPTNSKPPTPATVSWPDGCWSGACDTSICIALPGLRAWMGFSIGTPIKLSSPITNAIAQYSTSPPRPC